MTRGVRVRAPASAALVLTFAFFAAPSAADETTPFRTRNLSPLVSIFGIPAWEPPPSERLSAGITAELANHYRFSRRGDEILILDGETWRTGLWLRRHIGRRWSVGVEVPYYRQSGGVLDDVVDAWHSAFGLPDGGRNRRPEGDIVYMLADARGPFFTLEQSDDGWGDVLLDVGRVLGDGRTYLRAAVKLPTGDEAVMAGSGSADVAVTVFRAGETSVRERPAGWFLGVGALRLGKPERLRYDARRVGAIGILGGSLKAWPRTGLKAQIEVHTPLYDSPLKELGDPGVQLTVGGWRELGARGTVELAVNEDLAVSTSPDVVLHLSFRWKFSQ